MCRERTAKVNALLLGYLREARQSLSVLAGEDRQVAKSENVLLTWHGQGFVDRDATGPVCLAQSVPMPLWARWRQIRSTCGKLTMEKGCFSPSS